MRSDTTRFKLGLFLLVPLIALGFIAAYSALDWCLVERMGWLRVDHEVVSFWIPIALASLLVIILVNPRIAILKLKEERNVPFLFTIVAIVQIAAPTVIAQNYIHAMSGTLVQVADASTIGPPFEKYYRANHICLDRTHAVADTAARSGGRNNERLSLYLYMATPLCGGRDSVRIGLIYNETINNRLSESEKEALYRAFLKRSLTQFGVEKPASFTYLERLGPGEDLRGFEKALRNGRVLDSPTILVPHTESFDKRAGSDLKWIAGILGAGTLGWLVMVLLAPIDRSKLLHPESVAKEREGEKIILWMLFVPSRSNWGLPLLLDTNILVYLAMALSGLGVASFQTDDLIAWGGNFGPALHGAGIMRLFTSQFVHGGLMHVLGNMYGLVFAALFLLPVASNARLVAAYLVCGLGGSLASLYMHPDIVSVGASGAIFGLFGMLLVLIGLGDKRLADGRNVILINAAIFVGLNLIIGAVTPAVDNAAHIGGLVAGLVLGAVLALIDSRKMKS